MLESRPMTGQTDDAAVVRRGFEFFNAGDLDALVTEVFHEEIDYAGDPQISGSPLSVA